MRRGCRSAGRLDPGYIWSNSPGNALNSRPLQRPTPISPSEALFPRPELWFLKNPAQAGRGGAQGRFPGPFQGSSWEASALPHLQNTGAMRGHVHLHIVCMLMAN